jgi:hypothetical protein
MTDDETVITAEFTEKKDQKKPGVFSGIAAYIKKNQEAEKKRREKTGEKSLSEELAGVGSDWGKNLMKGMKEVGDEQESSLTGRRRSPGSFDPSDDITDEILFGKKPKPRSDGPTPASELFNEKQFIEKLCEFLRYVEEDDDVKMWQHRGKVTTVVDYKYLSKLLTRFYGHKIVLKERDLSIK